MTKSGRGGGGGGEDCLDEDESKEDGVDPELDATG